jgi:hypothetical protein
MRRACHPWGNRRIGSIWEPISDLGVNSKQLLPSALKIAGILSSAIDRTAPLLAKLPLRSAFTLSSAIVRAESPIAR